VSTVLDEVLELAPEERGAYLDGACAHDPALRAEVEQLLGHGERGNGFLDEPARYAAPLLASAMLDSAPVRGGARVGPYRVVREIGHGGMGTVYLAERDDDQFRQRVALKLVRGGLGWNEVVVRRFVEERQILALLDHPNIARLLDGGITDDGLPWFAMEYVEGSPIDTYVRDRALPVDERLALFLSVCDAVQHAHRNLIVHRDLKPSNILVGSDARPRLLDFGIAKLLARVEEGRGALTSTGLRVMTPEYASPEQIRGDPITVAADVYSLGVLLYELLAGQRPYRVTGRLPHEVERAILEEEPARPSTVVDSSNRRRLRGDLDTIVLTAMQKDPRRRYASVEQLAGDVRLHLSGQPISARAETRLYRWGKFVRRHRLGVAAAAAVVLALMGGLAAVTWQARAARREAAKANAIKTFALGLFQVSDPGASRGRTITARELLDKGAARVDSEFARQPEVRAEMMSALGSIYQNLGLYEPATPLLEGALALRRSIHGPKHLAVASSLNELGGLLVARGRHLEAESLFHQSLVIRRARLGENAPEVLFLRNNIAVIHLQQGDHRGADSLLRQVLAGQRIVLAPDDPEVANTLTNLGITARALGNFAEAEQSHREALAIRRARFGDVHPTVGESLRNIAVALHSMGRYPEAEAAYREAIGVQRAVYGPKHPKLAPTLSSLAALLAATGNDTAAEPLFREALAMQREQLGAEHREVASTLGNLAGLLSTRGELEAALHLYEETLAMQRRILGRDHASVATTLNGTATVLREQGRYAAAEPLLTEALAIYRSRLGPRHQHVGVTLRNLAAVRFGLKDYAGADSLYRESLAIHRTVLPSAHPDIGGVLVGLGRTRLALGDHEGAEPMLREALAIQQNALPRGHWRVAEARRVLGECLAGRKRYGEAGALLLDGYRNLEGATNRRSESERTALLRQLIAVHDASGHRVEAARYRAMLRTTDPR
jgi:serine/threonine-protein kinase